MSWGKAQLGEIAVIERRSIAPSDIASGTRYVGLEHIESGGGSLSFGKVANGELASNKFRFSPNHILFGKLRPYLAKIAAPDFEGICSTDILPILPTNRVDKRYLLHFLRLNRTVDWAAGRATGVNLPRLSPSELASLEIPLPPLPEQRRIAAILDRADALRRKRKRAIRLLDSLTQSIFLEMFGDPGTNPKQFERGTIGDLLEETQYGTSAKAGAVGAFPILRMGNVTNDGRVVVDDLKFIDLSDNEIEKYTVRKGDILFNRTNSAELVGKTAVFEAGEPFAFAGYLVRARTKKMFSPHYVSGYLNSQHGKATLRNMAKSIVGMANINAKEMASIPILIPDQISQERYETVLGGIQHRRREYEVQSKQMESLFASLQSRAFSGQL